MDFCESWKRKSRDFFLLIYIWDVVLNAFLPSFFFFVSCVPLPHALPDIVSRQLTRGEE
jgi:hypothetical protein